LEAIKTYESILQKEPNNPSAANTLGMILVLAKQKDKAETIWKNAANANKYEAIFPIDLARLYVETDENQAIHYYSKALEIDPASELFRLEFAKYLIKQEKKQEAKEVITKGLTYSPGFHNVYIGFKEMEELLTKL
jgi:predicted Zn-dependent protease